MATRSADILPLYKIGVVFGILTLRLNPNKLHRKNGPFEVFMPLLIYSFAVWTCFLIICFLLYQDFRRSRPGLIPALGIMVGVVNSYFLIFLCIQRKSVVVITNKLYRLHLKYPNTQVTTADLIKLLFPLGVYFFKIIFDYDWYSQTPIFHLLAVFYITVFVTVYGTLYCWLIFGEKILLGITFDVNSKYRIMPDLITSFLNVEEFVRLISKYFGIFHLLIGVQVVGVYIAHFGSKVINILSTQEFNKATISVLIHVAEWNIFMYIMFFTTYQSHKLTLQVRRLKHNLEEVYFKNNIDDGALNIILLFKNKLKNNEDIVFSAFESVHFGFQQAVVVLNTIITLMSTVSSISWQE